MVPQPAAALQAEAYAEAVEDIAAWAVAHAAEASVVAADDKLAKLVLSLHKIDIAST